MRVILYTSYISDDQCALADPEIFAMVNSTERFIGII